MDTLYSYATLLGSALSFAKSSGNVAKVSMPHPNGWQSGWFCYCCLLSMAWIDRWKSHHDKILEISAWGSSLLLRDYSSSERRLMLLLGFYGPCVYYREEILATALRKATICLLLPDLLRQTLSI